MIKVNLNGTEVEVEKNQTILEVANKIGTYIPTLCFLKGVNETSQCRMCLVEIEGVRGFKPACATICSDQMVVNTNSESIKNAVKFNLELIAGEHTFECWNCPREEDCELLDLLRYFDIEHKYSKNRNKFTAPNSVINGCNSIVFDSGKCVLCHRCISTCNKTTKKDVISFHNRGENTIVKPVHNLNISESGCIYCGNCIQNCPVSAITESNSVNEVLNLLQNTNKKLIVQYDSRIKYFLTETVADYSENLAGLFQEVGFKHSFDLSVGEAVHDFLLNDEIVKNKTVIEASDFSIVNYLEIYNYDLLKYLSKVKSPHTLQGIFLKQHYCKDLGLNAEDTIVVSILPNVSAKAEIEREEYDYKSLKDVDYVLTFRELLRLFRRVGADVNIYDYAEQEKLENINYLKKINYFTKNQKTTTTLLGEEVAVDYIVDINTFAETFKQIDSYGYLNFNFSNSFEFYSGGQHHIKSYDLNQENVYWKNIAKINDYIADEEIEITDIEKIYKKLLNALPEKTMLYTDFQKRKILNNK